MKVSRKGPGITKRSPVQYGGLIGLAIAAARLKEERQRELEEKLHVVRKRRKKA